MKKWSNVIDPMGDSCLYYFPETPQEFFNPGPRFFWRKGSKYEFRTIFCLGKPLDKEANDYLQTKFSGEFLEPITQVSRAPKIPGSYFIDRFKKDLSISEIWKKGAIEEGETPKYPSASVKLREVFRSPIVTEKMNFEPEEGGGNLHDLLIKEMFKMGYLGVLSTKLKIAREDHVRPEGDSLRDPIVRSWWEYRLPILGAKIRCGEDASSESEGYKPL